MRKIIIAITLFSLFVINPANNSSNAAYSSGTVGYEDSLTQCSLEFEDSTLVDFEESKRGCCSWHEGVCDCSLSGRVICCDGTKSPSCRCD